MIISLGSSLSLLQPCLWFLVTLALLLLGNKNRVFILVPSACKTAAASDLHGYTLALLSVSFLIRLSITLLKIVPACYWMLCFLCPLNFCSYIYHQETGLVFKLLQVLKFQSTHLFTQPLWIGGPCSVVHLGALSSSATGYNVGVRFSLRLV